MGDTVATIDDAHNVVDATASDIHQSTRCGPETTIPLTTNLIPTLFFFYIFTIDLPISTHRFVTSIRCHCRNQNHYKIYLVFLEDGMPPFELEPICSSTIL